MKLPSEAHLSRPWRIHELTGDFRLEDVWALPTPGGPDDFPRLVEAIAAGDPSHGSSPVVRALFAIRWKLGELLGWDDADDGIASRVPTLRDRLPADLRAVPSGPDFDALPFQSLYLLDDEWAGEIANRTMHGVMHLGWVPDGDGGFRGQLAVLVKPNGLSGAAYMAAIRPFRYVLVYPALLRQIGETWRARTAPARARVSTAVGLDNVPAPIRSLAAMTDPDYVDAITITTDGAVDASPEQWARALLEDTATGRAAPRLWRLLGLRLGPRPSADHVQGWKIADRGDDWIRLETSSWFMTGHALVHVGEGTVCVALFVRFDLPIAAVVWPPVSVTHRRAVPAMLRQALRAPRIAHA